jgi:hypothetical protein
MIMGICACLLWLESASFSAPKPHSVSFGKWTSIRLVVDGEEKQIDARVRPLLVDGRTKEFTVGQPHDVTERTFVVQRVYRLNGSLPQETGAIHWFWQPGGWLLVDRSSGKVQTILLPAFEPSSSDVNWFRDYAAYCGTSDDAQKGFAIVAQLGRRKPLLKKTLTDSTDGQERKCKAPIWQRDPARVTFEPKDQAKFTYTVRNRAVDPTTEDEDRQAGEE